VIAYKVVFVITFIWKGLIMSTKGNNLIIIENKILTEYHLDNRNVWEIGRVSKGNTPDICLHAGTVSRKHGKFENVDGVWFYFDYNSKNGTVYNGSRIATVYGSFIRPIILDDGDTLIFGGGGAEVIDERSVFGMYTTETFDGGWRQVDTNGCTNVRIVDSDGEVAAKNPRKGTVVKNDDGIAIYMDDLTYMTGKLQLFFDTTFC
jgi:pSer/pThr/pTyr-binding forkhead associated (FHA) protein